MNKKASYRFDSDYLLIIILLIFSGDPITRFMGKYVVAFASIVIFASFYNRIKKDFYALFFGIAVSLLLLFLCQYVVLGYVSWLGALNYINLYFLGGLIIYLTGERFRYKLFIIVSYVSLISLVLYVPMNLLSIHVPGLDWKPERTTYIIYTFVEQHHYRNCGIFWEPGAFAGVLTLCMALNVKELPVLWQKHKLKVTTIVTALITTQSTTGYIVFFFIGCYFLIVFVKDRTVPIIILPVLLVIAILVYSNAGFLQDKLEHQSETTLTLEEGEFSNNRFGSFIFDMNYIKKHPLVGNGFSETTRYADNPELIRVIQMGGDIGNGNGLSNYMASLGIPFMVCYLFLTFTALLTIDQKAAVLVTLVILLSLISEQWLAYPIFTGMMFVNNKKKLLNE
jgi:hypothetical protein